MEASQKALNITNYKQNGEHPCEPGESARHGMLDNSLIWLVSGNMLGVNLEM